MGFVHTAVTVSMVLLWAVPVAAEDVAERSWADVRKDGADVYEDVEAIRAQLPVRHLDTKNYVAIRPKTKPIRIDGVVYLKTDQGWIASRDLSRYSPSTYAGIELAPNASLELGWAVARKPGAKIKVHPQASPDVPHVRVLEPRERVTILEHANGFARIGLDEWVDVVELRRPERQPRPSGVTESERWIDVDLGQQVLVAYEGDTPVFATVISSGKKKWETPTGIYRITGKDATARMQHVGMTDVEEGDRRAESWNVAAVPFSMRFRKNFALHGTYWHEGFGRQRSHGCVNLSTSDAKRVFDWVTPLAETAPGTAVRIRSQRDPDPQWRDFDGKRLDVLATK